MIIKITKIELTIQLPKTEEDEQLDQFVSSVKSQLLFQGISFPSK